MPQGEEMFKYHGYSGPCPKPPEPKTGEPPPPQHPFEVRIMIGGDDWDYVQRSARIIAAYIEEREPGDCSLASGGGGGSYSVSVASRNVSVEQFHKELEEWRLSLPKLTATAERTMPAKPDADTPTS
jgi:hypothetical protein